MRPGASSATTDDEVRVEREANEFFEWFAADPGPRRHALREPLRTLRSLLRLRRLPVIDVPLSRSREGLELYGAMHRAAFSRITMAGATAVVRLPSTPEEYSLGSSMQTLRRKSRAALKAGVHWEFVDDMDRRRELLRLADEAERTNARAEYRMEVPVLEGLEHVRLWMVAYGRDEQPLLISVTPVDGEWGVLRYFRTLVASDDASLARYYMSQILAEQLIARGVRYLTDSLSPLRLNPGLRHFQRMVGFRLVRTRPHLVDAGAQSVGAASTEVDAAR